MRLAGIVVAVIAVFAAGCSLQDAAEKSAPKDAVALAEKSVADFRAQNGAALAKDMAPSMIKAFGNRAVTEKMRAAFPAGPATAVHVESWSSVKQVGNIFGKDDGVRADLDSVTRLSLRYEFRGGDAVRVVFVMAPNFGKLQVYGMHLTPLPAALLQKNAIARIWTTFQPQHLVLLFAVGLVIFTIATAISCLRTENLKFKWLWFLVTLIGAVQITMNWTSGEFYLNPLVIRVPPMWIEQASPYDPAMLWFVLPLGAVIFRTWRRFWGPA